uniref:Large ribosomal subunit protein uL6c n=1 Tax=Corallina officinalis TaxID=35170 RepID=A0A6M3WAP4_COROI|nr:50S ribosomal protein L6 [Corallina officinalis]QJF58521.1 50S ribosomal protein L6 [Corallina officinalis]QJF58720.1 50S ribosomal protein L6 [Corallina officinalis]QJF58919.1 50S ribosomal protein L6 [Corallina officinalis]
MSRIGKNPIPISSDIDVTIDNKKITIKGPKGELKHLLAPQIDIKNNKTELIVSINTENKTSKQLHGLSRTLLNNMVIGVSKGFCKTLEIQGVGYRAQINQKNQLILNVGYSHSIYVSPPSGIKIEVENNTIIKIHGINKETVGQLAAKIRSLRPPEPYKGKGIRYTNEIIRRKVGKAGK